MTKGEFKVTKHTCPECNGQGFSESYDYVPSQEELQLEQEIRQRRRAIELAEIQQREIAHVNAMREMGVATSIRPLSNEEVEALIRVKTNQ